VSPTSAAPQWQEAASEAPHKAWEPRFTRDEAATTSKVAAVEASANIRRLVEVETDATMREAFSATHPRGANLARARRLSAQTRSRPEVRKRALHHPIFLYATVLVGGVVLAYAVALQTGLRLPEGPVRLWLGAALLASLVVALGVELVRRNRIGDDFAASSRRVAAAYMTAIEAAASQTEADELSERG
jgi:energy-converting hydrogenase Eha subunit A